MNEPEQNLSSQCMLNFLRGVGEETRLRLLVLLSRGERTVKDLTCILNQSQPRISRHLKLMMEGGIVERYQEGSWVFYRLCDSSAFDPVFRQIVDLVSPDDPLVASDLAASALLNDHRREEAQAYFQQHADQWDEIRSRHIPEKQVEQCLSEILKGRQVELAVDLGTGIGHALELLASHAKRAIGIDLNSHMLTYARARMETRNLGHCQLRQGDLYALPLKDEMADIILMHQVLHFLETPQKAVYEACRILKPEGLLLIVDFAAHDLEILREQHAHQRLGFEPETIESWLECAGLEVSGTIRLNASSLLEGQNVSMLVWSAHKPVQPAFQNPSRSIIEKEQEV